jgi:predicted lysophospholipase L1 biosynthesis ABC-type transport system permease subunit
MWGSPSAAIGKRIRRWTSMPWTEVIGVVQDMYENGVQEKAPTIVYWPELAEGYWGPGTLDAIRSATFIVRSDRAGTESFLGELRQAVWSVNSNVPVASMRTMQDIYSQSLARISFTLVMLGIAGSMALALGFIGLYGVISYAVSQRTREIGIRLALGAEKGKIFRMVIGQGLRLTVAGVAVGVIATVFLGRLASSFSQLLYGVSITNPAILTAVSFALVIVAAIACYLPARRAASVEPMKALRAE